MSSVLRSVMPRAILVVLLGLALIAPTMTLAAKPPTPPPPPDPPQLQEDADPQDTMQRRVGDKLAIGTSLTVAADEFVQGSVVCIGCHGRIEGRVLGDIVVIGGKLEMSGSGVGQLVSVAGRVELEPTARINGDVVNVAGYVRRNDNQVSGQVVDLGGPGVMAGLHGLGGLGTLGFFDTFFGLWFTLLTWVLLVVVLMLLAALVPDRIRRIAEEVPVIPLTAFLWGLLAYMCLPFAVLLLIISCIGIPILPFAWFAFKILKWLGMAGIFLFTGRRIGRWFHREIPLLGSILLGMLPYILIRALPFCVGWFAWFILEIFAVGYVIATRAGRPPVTPVFVAPTVAPEPLPPLGGPQPPPVAGLP